MRPALLASLPPCLLAALPLLRAAAMADSVRNTILAYDRVARIIVVTDRSVLATGKIAAPGELEAGNVATITTPARAITGSARRTRSPSSRNGSRGPGGLPYNGPGSGA